MKLNWNKIIPKQLFIKIGYKINYTIFLKVLHYRKSQSNSKSLKLDSNQILPT